MTETSASRRASQASGGDADAAASCSSSRPLRVILAGGGTAGHVNPLLATVAQLRAVDPRTEILALGTAAGMESRLFPEAGVEMVEIPRVPLPRRPSGDMFRMPGKLRRAIVTARQAIDSFHADVVIGFGSYVSTPAYLAARAARIPVVIHEQNARPGLANRLGASWAQALALTFASTPLTARRGTTRVTGLPLRPEIAELVAARATAQGRLRARREAAAALGCDPDLLTIVVTGGSLGALSINEVMCQAMGELPQPVQVLHLTGRNKDAAVYAARDRALASGLMTEEQASRYHIRDYESRMHLAYALADAVICRSGAGTVAELTALGLPALYVPLPIGNGEQKLNAADVVAAHGGVLCADKDLSVSRVTTFMRRMADAQSREQMSQAAAASGVQDAAQRLVALTYEVLGRPLPEDAASRYHLLGIGGAGMSVVAQLLAAQGAQVSGSDAHRSATLEALVEAGIDARVGHDADRIAQLPEGATVVVSTAIKDTNPELSAARERGLRVIHRSEALALAARGKDFVAVAGAHGKTTTSGMLAIALREAGTDPSFAVGGIVTGLGSGAHCGSGRAFVAEADESDRSFLNYRPRVEIVTNVEPDHLDTYGSAENFEQAFLDFSHRLTPDGVLIACSDDPGALRLAQRAAQAGHRVLTYGAQGAPDPAVGEGHVSVEITQAGALDTQAQVCLSRTAQVDLAAHVTPEQTEQIPAEQTPAEQTPAEQSAVSEPGTPQFAAQSGSVAESGAAEQIAVELHLALPGSHMALNAAAAWAAGVELGVDPQEMAHALSAFRGTGRRFEQRGECNGVLVIDDYAHHPTEIEALVRTASVLARSRGGKLRLLFQPHLFSRTENFAERFAQALDGADDVIVTDIYPAREQQADFPQVTSDIITSRMSRAEHLYVPDAVEAAITMAERSQPGDVVMTVGAGSITSMGDVIIEALGSTTAPEGSSR